VKVSAAGEYTGFEGLNSSRTVGGLWGKMWAKYLKESKLIKLRRESSIENTVE
jgi:hypothetical protein